MFYLAAIVLYIGACFRLARALAADKHHLVESGASPSALLLLQWALWLFAIPLLASAFPLSALWPKYIPFLLILLLFVPAVAIAGYILRQIPKGGYDFQRRAAGHIREVIWLGCGGAALLLVALSLFPLLGWAIAHT
jgi:hypothetical protein